ncbi:MAG: DUF4215 domain-containing protein [Deltaproteobacteria bacterium]|nr:DUF4215 domain-containing protein [Deltaproteobacteria bacterium]
MSWLRRLPILSSLFVPLLPAACFQVPDIDDTDAGSLTDGASTTSDPATGPGATSESNDSTMTSQTGVDSTGDGPDAVCGDGMLSGAESCDDGNTDDGDGCSSTCSEEAGFACEGEPSVCASVCGDGVAAPDEACDDGNVIGGDGCDRCTVERGYECTGDAPSVCAGVCGDGMLVVGETCDDANAVAGDGCSDQCVVELYYRCANVGPGSCSPVRALFVPADDDDEAFRDAIAAVTGGPVDHFDASTGTPMLPDVIGNYDCLLTYPNGNYADAMALGTLLANFVDLDGAVVLGLATGLPMAGLGGTPIAGEGYSPVGQTDLEFLMAPVQYVGDGTSVLVQGIGAFGVDAVIDSMVALQGAGIADGTYDNGTIAIAHRPDFKVVYLNGTGHEVIAPTGEWGLLSANACAASFVQ